MFITVLWYFNTLQVYINIECLSLFCDISIHCRSTSIILNVYHYSVIFQYTAGLHHYWMLITILWFFNTLQVYINIECLSLFCNISIHCRSTSILNVYHYSVIYFNTLQVYINVECVSLFCDISIHCRSTLVLNVYLYSVIFQFTAGLHQYWMFITVLWYFNTLEVYINIGCLSLFCDISIHCRSKSILNVYHFSVIFQYS